MPLRLYSETQSLFAVADDGFLRSPISANNRLGWIKDALYEISLSKHSSAKFTLRGSDFTDASTLRGNSIYFSAAFIDSQCFTKKEKENINEQNKLNKMRARCSTQRNYDVGLLKRFEQSSAHMTFIYAFLLISRFMAACSQHSADAGAVNRSAW